MKNKPKFKRCQMKHPTLGWRCKLKQGHKEAHLC